MTAGAWLEPGWSRSPARWRPPPLEHAVGERASPGERDATPRAPWTSLGRAAAGPLALGTLHAAIAVPVWPGLGSPAAAAPPAPTCPPAAAAAARDGMAPRCLLLRCCCGGQVHDADAAPAPAPGPPAPSKSRKCTASCQQPPADSLVPSYVSEPPPSCRKLLRKREGPSKVSECVLPERCRSQGGASATPPA
ncbi:Truncated polyprotein 1aTF [Frankliniella fusca]|uniref:Truncated polyprotein 1aTF n=1 Tax=Frankliniella fusca TaxID=407009 RepID=A0AAE1HWG2_9NEOP|nr:Truncated polyprotein 1aTF [Frankliniella fusca]